MAASSLETSSVRARRRPARYSPELPQSEMSNGVLAAQQHDGSFAEDGEEVIPSAVAAVVYNGEMAPAVPRGPGRPPSKHKKRKSLKKRPTQIIEEPTPKRPRVANVLLENETLIDEIRNRKALWMRTHEQHHSSVLTAPYWEDVAKACDLTGECFFPLFLF